MSENRSFVRKITEAVILAAVPIGIAILMQRPALRQQMMMRMTHGMKTYCQAQADFWQNLALKAGTAYQKARM